jgi:flagellar motor switch protein FliN/FliY
MNHDIEDMVGQSTDTSAEVISKQTTESEEPTPSNLFNANDLGILNEVSITLSIEIGRAQIKIRDLLNLTKDSIIDLNKLAGEPVDIYANGKLISKGNIITANGKYCVRLLSIPNTK